MGKAAGDSDPRPPLSYTNACPAAGNGDSPVSFRNRRHVPRTGFAASGILAGLASEQGYGYGAKIARYPTGRGFGGKT